MLLVRRDREENCLHNFGDGCQVCASETGVKKGDYKELLTNNLIIPCPTGGIVNPQVIGKKFINLFRHR